MLVRPKDPVLPEERIGVVYRIPCKDCSKAYVGQSARSLTLRLKEYQKAVHNVGVNALTIAEHVWQERHQMDWTSVEVVAAE